MAKKVKKKVAKKKPTNIEKLKKDLATKKVYHYIDTEREIDQISREVFKKKDVEIHFPIGYRGGSKYKHAKSFIYEGFNGKLPVGVSKTASRGLGFTKVLRPLMDYLEANFNVGKIRIVKAGSSGFTSNKKELCFTENDLIDLHAVFQNTLDKHRVEKEQLAIEQLHLLFPKAVKKGKKKYVKNSISSVLSAWTQSVSDFSGSDKNAIKDLFDKLSLTDSFFDTDALLKTKATIDAKYIEGVAEKFEKFMQQKTHSSTLEKKWQQFLKNHSWIFSYMFSFPIILLDDEAYVGGKNISNKDGKITDFLVQNDLTQNVAFIEIKTHKAELVKKGKAYRGTDVFAMSSDLSGGISQVLNQRDNFQKQFAVHKMNSKEVFESFNSKCVVLIGLISDMDKDQIKSFELFRSNSKDVEILTFDELLARFKNLKLLMSGKVK